ncbi:MAG TPA: Hpt domain-containing protein, partial [Gammaproteobacteria bacterium]|nr:Hpt domain-containing protein [Gammaproteobacteria bacterium]
MHEPSEKTRELIELVSAELGEIVEFYHANAVSSEQDIGTVVKEAAVLVGNIANAVKLIGLDALSDLCEGMSQLFDQADFAQSRPTAAVNEILEKWPQLLLAYLQTGFSAEASRQLVAYLADNELLVSADASLTQSVVDRLCHPIFPEEDKQVRYDIATQDDVDLTLPEDVNPELLESLLQDLPKQTEELTAALLSIREANDIASIEIAQRIAHTLKGSANVVGVKGIANISHHLEDILEHLTKSRQKPSAQLMEVLMTSADCIESMAEALLGYDAPPEHALEILQTILNWSNKISEQGLDAVVSSDEPVTVNDVAQGCVPNTNETAKSRSKDTAVENTLRIPAHLADDLLRLAGENLITTGQIQESIKNSLNKQGLLKNHNRLLQQLAFDLEHLIDIQGITSNFG